MEKTNEVLWKQYKEEGCEASLVELIQQNEGLIISCAKNWQFAYGAKRIEFEDLCSVGKEALLKAVYTYNPDRGAKFSTHATEKIESYMQRYVMKNARYISYPEEVLRKINKINKCRPEGDTPDLYDWYENYTKINKEPIPYEKFKSFVQIESELGSYSSLNELLGDEQKDALLDMIGTTESPEEIYLEASLKEEIVKCLEILSDQERQVLTLMLGLNGNPEMKQAQIAKELGVSEARISDIKKKVKYELRNSSKAKGLREYIEK